MPDPRPVRIPVEEIDTVCLLREALVRHEAMKLSNPAYQTSTLRMQEVGLLGEYAVTHWLREHHTEVAVIADQPDARRTGAGDVSVVRQLGPAGAALRQCVEVTFEVKTSRYASWQQYARTLDAAQLHRSTADAYIWCVVSNNWPTESVLLMGWLPTSDVKAPHAGVHVSEHDRPHWRVTADLRPMRDLPRWWASVPVVPF